MDESLNTEVGAPFYMVRADVLKKNGGIRIKLVNRDEDELHPSQESADDSHKDITTPYVILSTFDINKKLFEDQEEQIDLPKIVGQSNLIPIKHQWGNQNYGPVMMYFHRGNRMESVMLIVVAGGKQKTREKMIQRMKSAISWLDEMKTLLPEEDLHLGETVFEEGTLPPVHLDNNLDPSSETEPNGSDLEPKNDKSSNEDIKYDARPNEGTFQDPFEDVEMRSLRPQKRIKLSPPEDYNIPQSDGMDSLQSAGFEHMMEGMPDLFDMNVVEHVEEEPNPANTEGQQIPEDPFDQVPDDAEMQTVMLGEPVEGDEKPASTSDDPINPFTININ